MTADWLLTAAGAVAFAALALAAVATAAVRSWAASTAGRAWTRRLGVLAVLVGGAAAAAFGSSPPLGVALFFAAGAVAFLAASLAAAGAADSALDAPALSLGRRVRAFWHAAAVHYRVTRYALAVAVVAFGLAAITGGVAVDPAVSAVGAFGYGGLFAAVAALASVGVFVPGTGSDPAAGAGRAG